LLLIAYVPDIRNVYAFLLNAVDVLRSTWIIFNYAEVCIAG